MISLRTLRVSDREFPALDRLNRSSFPPAEYFDLTDQLRLQDKGEFSVWAIYEEEALSGFISFRHGEGIAYLCYLAIEEARRSRGIGSAVLQRAREMFADCQLVVDFEILDPRAENYIQRVRRKRFYLRNSFAETGWGTEYFGVTYEICCANRPFDIDLFRKMMLNANIPDFHPRYFHLEEYS